MSSQLSFFSILLRVVQIGLAVGLVLGVVNVARLFRRSRTATYFILRRAAATRAGRWLLILIVSGLGLAGTLRIRLPVASERPAATPTAIFEVVELPTGTATRQPLTALPSASPPPTITLTTQTIPVATLGARSGATLVPTATPSPLFVTRESDVTPGVAASIDITTISGDISDDFLPVNAGSDFGTGLSRFYVFFDYEGMEDGVSWSGLVFIDGDVAEEVSFDQLWTLGEAGTNLYRWFDRDGGWPAGEYDVQFYVGDRLVDTATFRITDTAPAEATGPTTP